jgi:hypothetical protein
MRTEQENAEKYFPIDKKASITKNGHYYIIHKGEIVGHTKKGLIKVKVAKGIKIFSRNNVHFTE